MARRNEQAHQARKAALRAETSRADREREAAAEALTHEITRTQFELSACHPADAIHDLPGGPMPGIAGAVADRFMASMEKDQWRFCSHLIARPQQPTFARTWKPLRLACNTCLPASGLGVPHGFPCDGCATVPRGFRLAIQTYQAGYVVLYFGLCEPCIDQMQGALHGTEEL